MTTNPNEIEERVERVRAALAAADAKGNRGAYIDRIHRRDLRAVLDQLSSASARGVADGWKSIADDYATGLEEIRDAAWPGDDPVSRIRRTAAYWLRRGSTAKWLSNEYGIAPEVHPSSAAATPEVEREAIENRAMAIYAQWAGSPGWVPWVAGGNSTKQDEARRIATADMKGGEA